MVKINKKIKKVQKIWIKKIVKLKFINKVVNQKIKIKY